jgi:hypothetical protein
MNKGPDCDWDHDTIIEALRDEEIAEQEEAEEKVKRDEVIEGIRQRWEDNEDNGDNGKTMVILISPDIHPILRDFIYYLLRFACWLAHLEPYINYAFGKPQNWRRSRDGICYPVFPDSFTALELGFYCCLIEFLVEIRCVRYDALRTYLFLDKAKAGWSTELWNQLVEIDDDGNLNPKWVEHNASILERLAATANNTNSEDEKAVYAAATDPEQFAIIASTEHESAPIHMQSWLETAQRDAALRNHGIARIIPAAGVEGDGFYGIANSQASCYAISVIQVLAHIRALVIPLGALGRVFRELRSKKGEGYLPQDLADDVIIESNLRFLDGTTPSTKWEIGVQWDPSEFFLRLCARYHMLNELCHFDVWSHGFVPNTDNERMEASIVSIWNYTIQNGQLQPCDFGNLSPCEERLISFAPLMVWNIQRLEFNQRTGHTERDMTMIPLEETVDITPLLHEDLLPTQQTYTLFAFITHLGVEREASSGHYIAFINFRGQWIMYNDEHVVGIDNDNAQAFLRLQAQAYMAFYISDFYRENHPESF